MLQVGLIHQFLAEKTIAVVGVSRDGDLPANHIYKKLRENNYRVYPVNPNAETVEGDKCYRSIGSLPSKPDAVMLASTPRVSEEVVTECITSGIKNIWMHRGIGEGSYSSVAEKYCRDHNVEPITNGCPMMFVGKVDWFHKFFRWIKK
jgi:predicted CoA-binding protein